MLLSITNLSAPADDLGFLLHKHPARLQRFALSHGEALVYYPQATAERCTASLLLVIDPVALVRGTGNAAPMLDQYVNDRPYVASSLLSVALAQVWRSALNGRCEQRPERVDADLELQAVLPTLPCRRGGETLVEQLFAPLGYTVQCTRIPLDPAFPDWGDSPYVRLELSGRLPLRRLLAHLYVLIPVLDDAKHYYVGTDELDKLLRVGAEWLPTHPLKHLIARRYLLHRRTLTDAAVQQLLTPDELAQTLDTPDNPAIDIAAGTETEADSDTIASEVGAVLDAATPDAAAAPAEPAPPLGGEARLEAGLSLNQQRMERVRSLLVAAGVDSVVDLGCGEGRLLGLLLKQPLPRRLVGVEVSPRTLAVAARRLRLDRLPERQRARIELLQGSLIYRDPRLSGFAAATVIEVIEHLEPERLAHFEPVLFASVRAPLILLSTPNREYNALFPGMAPGAFRHADHRFEWTRAEFADWCRRMAARYGYRCRIEGIGTEDPELGAPTQLAVFELQETADAQP